MRGRDAGGYVYKEGQREDPPRGLPLSSSCCSPVTLRSSYFGSYSPTVGIVKISEVDSFPKFPFCSQ